LRFELDEQWRVLIRIEQRRKERVKARTEELLYLLLWTFEKFSRPTFRNLTDSFPAWAHRRGFQRQLDILEKKKFLESRTEDGIGRVHQLTEAGRLRALGGRDPKLAWRRRWDKQWRLVIFDIPQKQSSARVRLRRSLGRLGFGYLQNSVWVTPDPLEPLVDKLKRDQINVKSLFLFQGRPCGGESDLDIARGAWNFDAINDAYQLHDKVMKQHPSLTRSDQGAARCWQEWFAHEREAWQHAMDIDPLLPADAQPPGYRGNSAWQERLKILRGAGRVLQF
jgi:phenylacetic acid degradation operon negative regulatory protein